MITMKINESYNYKKSEDRGKNDKIESVFTILFKQTFFCIKSV